MSWHPIINAQKEWQDEHTRKAAVEVWERLCRRESRPTILDNLQAQGITHAEANDLFVKVEAKWSQIREEDRQLRAAIIIATGDFVICWVTTLITVYIMLDTNIRQEMARIIHGFGGKLAEFIADKMAGIPGMIIGGLYTLLMKDSITCPIARRAASYGYAAFIITGLLIGAYYYLYLGLT